MAPCLHFWAAMRNEPNGSGRCLARGALAGAVGGVAGALAMNAFQWVWWRADRRRRPLRSQRGRVQQGAPLTKFHEREPATQRLAGRIVRNAAGREASPGERKAGGAALHYMMGAGAGAAYGAAAAGGLPAVTVGGGMPFGAAVWVLADEVAVPLLRLSQPPTRHPFSSHVMDFCSHLVF